MAGLFDVSKEIILVTGASQGLGRQFARVLSAHGAAVALAARQTAKLKSLEDEIRSKGGRAVAVQMDVTDTSSIAGAIDGAEAALGPVSVLINNAGIALVPTHTADCPENSLHLSQPFAEGRAFEKQFEFIRNSACRARNPTASEYGPLRRKNVALPKVA